MSSFTYLLVLCAILIPALVSADILWDTCEGPADHPSIKEGNYYNLCIRDHTFTNERHSWTFTKSNLGDVVFDNCFFENTMEKTNNFTLAKYNNVEFNGCRFESFTDVPITFDSTVMSNVVFKDCVFHSSVDIRFEKFLMNNVTFDSCKFESNLFMTLGEANQIKFTGSKFKRSEHATTPSGTDSITFRLVTIRDMLIKESEFVTPFRLEGVKGADMSYNDTSFSTFDCHSKPEGGSAENPRIRYLSGFNDTAFQTVTVNDKFTCDRTKLQGLFIGNSTFYADADFSRTDILDFHMDDVVFDSLDGTCHEFDASHSMIHRKILANTTVRCKATFDYTIFETVLVKNFFAKKPSFSNAEFREQEFVDSHCCTRACQPLGCMCNISEPSSECPIGKSNVNVRAAQACFPSDATVKRPDGLVIRMEDLAIAEKIAVGGGEYSDVFFFGHRSSTKETEFVSIRHASATRPLRMSAGHYLYVNGGLRTAQMVRPGDRLRGADGEDNLMVTEVKRETGRGMYAPTSVHGDLLVDGVVVSSYTNALHPGVAHKLLHPLRLLYRYGFDSIVSRMTFLHERSLSGFSEAVGIPRGPDIVEK